MKSNDCLELHSVHQFQLASLTREGFEATIKRMFDDVKAHRLAMGNASGIAKLQSALDAQDALDSLDGISREGGAA